MAPTGTTTNLPSATAATAADDNGSGDHSCIAKPQILSITVKEVKELGSSTNKPTKQYVSHVPEQPMKLSADLTVPGLNLDLIHGYILARRYWEFGALKTSPSNPP